ncbi:2-octaprenyl-6-methoxyphenyl hydroxylase [Pseudidiomarina salilacus]|uniref:2-octaprenyl-6-methoxyphenyl hydroxylase n=1 Tax=Pseudidiomarina salilacus TaxID=3384452 RepID=UPI003984CC3E
MDATAVTQTIVIAGGGLVGSLTALLVARQRADIQLLVVEPTPAGPVPDKRTIALAAATVELLEREGLWSAVAGAAEGIQHIHVSDKGYCGVTRLHAEQEGVPALGQVVPAAHLNRALFDALAQMPNVEWRAEHQVSDFSYSADYVTVELQGPQHTESVRACLLIGADGQRSLVRERAGIAQQTTDYGQTGIIATLELADDLDGWAYERFTDTGPVALLPLPNRAASLVWSVETEHADAIMALPEAEFVRRVQQVFGYRAGRFTGVSGRIAYPLQLHLAERSVAHRTVIIGNASHTLHPIAGQGFNLGVRDAICLSQQLAQSTDPGSYTTLADYWQLRAADYQQIIGLTDGLVRGFSNHYWPLTKARNLALLGLDALPPLRHAFAARTMGLAMTRNWQGGN